MAEIITPSPLPFSPPSIRPEDKVTRMLADDMYKAGGDKVLEPEAYEALRELMPAINDIGWVVINDALTDEWVGGLDPMRSILGQSAINGDGELDAVLPHFVQAKPALGALMTLSRVGLRSLRASSGGNMRLNLAMDGFERHADCGDGHTFLANPQVMGGVSMNYELGGQEDQAQKPELAPQDVLVQGRSLLILGAEALKTEDEEIAGDTAQMQYRTVTHSLAGIRSDWNAQSAILNRVRLLAYSHYARTPKAIPMDKPVAQ